MVFVKSLVNLYAELLSLFVLMMLMMLVYRC